MKLTPLKLDLGKGIFEAPSIGRKVLEVWT